MPKVKFLYDDTVLSVDKALSGDKYIEVEEGTTILQAARLAGVLIESPCNGVGICGKCKVTVDRKELAHIVQGGNCHSSSEEASSEEKPLSEKKVLSGKAAAEEIVLACQAQVFGDISVKVGLTKKRDSSLKILNQGKSFDVRLQPYVRKVFDENRHITDIYAGDEKIGTEQGNTTSSKYGVVVDIGTTTLVVSLVNMNTREELAASSALNPQSLHAQDVLSRIKFASEENGLNIMHTELIKELNRLIEEVTSTSGVDPENVYELVFSGNTCMLHLASNVDPCLLGKYPYHVKINGGSHIAAKEHALKVSSFGIIYLPPVISAYVGPDITSGILASQLQKQEGTTLFVDIGTNGEMVIGVNGELSATSTAAGPAFEGMNITYGMRAAAGAVELFHINDDGSIHIKTIGDADAVGICGSGLLDIVGELVAFGVIHKNGKYVDPETAQLLPELRERLVKKDGKTVFMVTDKIYLSQKDVRQVQLAKGAIRAGIEFLLQSKSVSANEVDRVFIAGSFGYHLRARSLIHLGLLPREFDGKIEFIGNTSKSGGQTFLLNTSYRSLMEHLVKKIEVIELANYKDFDKVFVKCLGF